MSDASTDPVAAYLAEIERDLTDGAAYPRRVMEQHAPRLLAAIGAVLELAGEMRKDAADLDQRAGKVADKGDPTRSALLSYRAQAHVDCAERLERIVSARLLGESRPRLREMGSGE